MTDLERAKEALTTIDCTCALCRDEEVRTTQLRGVAPLLSWLEEGLSGWSVADRVVGAGAAWLYTLLHPAMVYACLLYTSSCTAPAAGRRSRGRSVPFPTDPPW